MPSPLAYLHDPPHGVRCVPTLYIGLGGTGRDVLLRLRRQICDTEEYFGHWAHRRFLCLDIDEVDRLPSRDPNENLEAVRLRPDRGEYVQCRIFPQEFLRVRDRIELQQDRQFAWVAPQLFELPPNMFEFGGGMHRQAGRLAFQLRSQAIRSQVLQHIRDLRRYALENQADVDDSQLHCVLVTSLAGGAGGGMFVDTAFLIRDVFNGPEVERGFPHCHTSLVALLPTPFERLDTQLSKLMRQNAYACLCDIERYSVLSHSDPLSTQRPPIDDGAITFRAPWSPHPIRGRPWQHCHLIDDVNDARTVVPLSYAELTRMMANFLLIADGRDELSRFIRHQLSFHRCDRGVSYVERIADPEHGAGQRQDFQISHGCGFSSFGVSEIYWDRPRTWLRTADHLALALLREVRAGAKGQLSTSTLQGMTRRDLLQVDVGEDGASFDPNVMWREFLRSDGGNWLDQINASFDRLQEQSQDLGADDILSLVKRWSEQLQPSAPAAINIEQRSREFRGTPHQWGRYESRLRKLVSARFHSVGCDGTLLLLDEYANALGQFLRQVERISDESLPPVDSLVAELRDAEMLPQFALWNARRRAIAKWFPIAVGKARLHVTSLFRAFVCREHLRPLFKLLLDHIRGIKSPELKPSHAGSQKEFQELGRFLDNLRDQLDSCQQALSCHDSQWSVGLLPDWNAHESVNVIRECSVGGEFAQGSESDERWKTFLRITFQQFVKLSQRTNQDDDLSALLDIMTDKTYDRFHVLERFRLHVRDCLCRLIDDRQWDARALADITLKWIVPQYRNVFSEKLVARSQPYLLGAHRNALVDPDHCTSVLSLGDILVGAEQRAEWEQDIILHNDDLGLPHPVVVGPTTPQFDARIKLVRVLQDVPLAIYARLSEFYNAYHANDQYRGLRLSRLDCSDMVEPALLLLSDADHTHIREARHLVPVALALGWISIESNSLVARVTDQQFGHLLFPLGPVTLAAIHVACQRDRVRQFLLASFPAWRAQATTDLRTCLLASLLLTKQQVGHGYPTRESNSIEGCYDRAIDVVSRDLNETEDGRQWLRLLGLDDPQPDSASNHDGPRRVLDLIRDRCLAQAHPAWTVWRIQPETPLPTLAEAQEVWTPKG